MTDGCLLVCRRPQVLRTLTGYFDLNPNFDPNLGLKAVMLSTRCRAHPLRVSSGSCQAGLNTLPKAGRLVSLSR